MKSRLLPLVVLAFGAIFPQGLAAQTSSAPGPVDCSLKADQLDALLALPLMSFDQDQSGGWRELQNKGCVLTAAMLIDAYLLDAPEELKTIHREDLYFHAGQLYAMAGLRKLAVRRILRSLNLHEGADEDIAWNAYALATVAFLQGDHEELAHRRQLLASAKSTRENGINLGVVDGLARCFDKPYSEAYSASCRIPAK
jgi:hypothetical protein